MITHSQQLSGNIINLISVAAFRSGKSGSDNLAAQLDVTQSSSIVANTLSNILQSVAKVSNTVGSPR